MEFRMDIKKLIGRTIEDVRWINSPEFDDENRLMIIFKDGGVIVLESGYGGYTGNSEGEYPAFLRLSEVGEEDLALNILKGEEK